MEGMVALLQKAWQGEGIGRGRGEVVVARVTAVESEDLAGRVGFDVPEAT